jgi:hypothetical protein
MTSNDVSCFSNQIDIIKTMTSINRLDSILRLFDHCYVLLRSSTFYFLRIYYFERTAGYDILMDVFSHYVVWRNYLPHVLLLSQFFCEINIAPHCKNTELIKFWPQHYKYNFVDNSSIVSLVVYRFNEALIQNVVFYIRSIACH